MPYWPALIVALTLTTYWGRVLRLVYKIRRVTGRDANFKPPERVGMATRLLWYPAVVLWVAYPYVVAFGKHLPPVLRPLFHNAPLAWVSSLVCVLALVGTMICWKKMGKSWRMGINPNEKTQLIVTGPYAYVRHPIYALSSALMLASLLALPSPLMLLVAAIHLTLLQWEARREEHYLVGQHGQSYVDYCQRVGRFVPKSLHPYHAAQAACCP